MFPDPDDNPQGTVDSEPVDDPLAGIADLLDDPADPDNDEDEAETAEADADEAEGEEAEDSDAEGTDEDADESEVDTGGKFVGDNARIRLKDGTTTTVKELKDGYFRQSDYTRKTTDVARERDEIKAERERVSQAAQQLHEQHELVNWWLEQTKPQRPQVGPDQDLIAHTTYQASLQQWNEARDWFNAERQKALEVQDKDRKTAETRYLERERDALLTAIPQLRDRSKHETFLNEAVRIGKKYGFTAEEIRASTDHRAYLLFRDLMRAEKASAKAPAVKAEVKSKPRLVRGRNRADPARQANRAEAQKIERLRNEGSLDAFVDSLKGVNI